MSVTNDLIGVLDKKRHCAALFVGLSKAFGSVDHKLGLDKLRITDFGSDALNWFKNGVSGRTQRVQAEGHESDVPEITGGVPHGSILAPLLFSICINDSVKDVQAELHLYVDDTLISSTTFQSLQRVVKGLKLVLND